MCDAGRALALALALSCAHTAASAAGGDPGAGPAPRAPEPAEPAPAAAADCAAALTARVQARYDRMRDLEARFVQRTASALAPSAEPMSGRVVLAKPGRMRWSYETPEPSEVVSDGRTLWIYDPAAREAQKFAVGEQFLSGAAFQFLLGSGRIADSFQVRADRCDAPRARLTLTPTADATYQALELEIDVASGEASATAVVDLFGNRTEVEFSELRYDRAPAASMFQFVPPQDVRVLEPEPAAH
ncbi:MAG TPA: outer membrane lipoprotein carrier protein LolA [Myxococcota bacterium]|nr:outer membrane lipoprotein carrier protein LolA [Myxococcota bacterium]